jgi:hypothetical protein
VVGRRGIPGAASRLLRDRLALVGVVLVAGLALSSSLTVESANLTLTGAVDANWRGAYDILVRPAGTQTSIEQTGGLIEPNFLGYAGKGGINLDQLAAIRAIDGVDIAAPVSVAGYLTYSLSNPTFFTDKVPDKPTLYRLTFTLSTSDGIQSIVLQQQEADALIGPEADVPKFRTVGVNFGGSVYPDGHTELDGSFVDYLPTIRSPLIGVDPVAEKALLGPTASFLDRFSLVTDPDHLTVGSVDPNLIPADFGPSQYLYKSQLYDVSTRPAVPVITTTGLEAPLTLTLDVTQVGHPIATYPNIDDPGKAIAKAETETGSTLTHIGSTQKDLSAVLRAFEPADYTVLWPGSGPEEGQNYANEVPQDYTTDLVTRPTYMPRAPRPGSGVPTYTVSSLGTVDPAGDTNPSPPRPGSGEVAEGIEPAYRKLVSETLAVGQNFLSQTVDDQPFYFAPIGSTDLSKLQLPNDPLDYVPLGIYDPPNTKVVAGADGKALATPEPIHATLNPAGFIDVPPLAITDLQGAEILRGSAPIDAIRVRVAGLTSFDADARAKVERVANAIRALGLDVDIVAGSSPQPVEIYVPSYFTSQTPSADLGYVAQSWTTLGAAQRVETGLGTTNEILLAAGLAIALLFAAALQLSRLATRRGEAAILRATGWGPGRIVSWLTAEATFAGVLVGVVAVGSWLLVPGHSEAGLVAGLTLAGLLPLAAFIGALLAVRGSGLGAGQRDDVWTGVPHRGVLRVRGPISHGIRSSVARPVRLIVAAIALALGSAAAAVSALIVSDVTERVGPTRLASALSQELRPGQIALLALLLVGGILTTWLLLRLDGADRRVEFRVLAASGWSPRRLSLSLGAQRSILGLCAALLGAASAAAAASSIGLVAPTTAAAIAAVLAASVIIWGALAVRPYRRASGVSAGRA